MLLNNTRTILQIKLYVQLNVIKVCANKIERQGTFYGVNYIYLEILNFTKLLLYTLHWEFYSTLAYCSIDLIIVLWMPHFGNFYVPS